MTDREMACELAGVPVPPRANMAIYGAMGASGVSGPPASQARAVERALSSQQRPEQNRLGSRKSEESTRSSKGKRARQGEEIDEQDQRPRKRVETGIHAIMVLTEPPPPEKPVSLPCVSCGDEYDPTSLAHMVCEHVYCQECLQQVVLNALNDEACYPPRCCRQPFEVRHLILAFVQCFSFRVIQVVPVWGRLA